MPLSPAAQLNQQGIPNQAAGKIAQIAANGTANKAAVAAVTALTVTATTGTLPTPDGSVTIANAATPTVLELQEFCVEINAKLNALRAALQLQV